MVDHLGGNLQSETCIHTYMKAHMYMLQTRAKHYQLETALVTHGRRSPRDPPTEILCGHGQVTLAQVHATQPIPNSLR